VRSHLSALGCLLVASALPAQTPAIPIDHPRVRPVLDALKTDNQWTIEQQISICEVEAPPFKEGRRAEEFRRRLSSFGFARVWIDPEGNVIAERPGSSSLPAVVVSAHLDTVFPEGTDVTVRREGTRLRAPGIGDDCRGLAVLLALARAFTAAGLETQRTVYYVGTVGEEGPGNLRGVRHLIIRELKDQVGFFISIDGTGMGITSRAVGSHRYRVSFEGPGGHSYGDFGIPNPIHALGRAIAGIAELRVPSSPKATFSVGVIDGGTSVNSIAASASADVDLRSASSEELAALDAGFRRAVAGARAAELARWNAPDSVLRVRLDTIGIRPAGGQADTALIVRTAVAARLALGQPDAATTASSTDANLPMSLGIPAITIDGGGSGDGSHSPAEWYDDGGRGYLGPQWAALIVAALAGIR
jgi:acetylornithine deacetylase/succinyl-diaminopimelate desuccinylase-like protein